jgi:hypothetical protein
MLGDRLPGGVELDGEVLAILVPAHPTLNKVAKAKMILEQQARRVNTSDRTLRWNRLMGRKQPLSDQLNR